MNKPKVYIETSVISYLTAWRARDVLAAAHQEATRQWWDEERDKFDLFISEVVHDEASRGDSNAARLRLEALSGIPELRLTDEVLAVARVLVEKNAVPVKAGADAFHIAFAAVHGMQYLLTWNFRHIANALLQLKIRAVCAEAGFGTPIICTPMELKGLENA